MTPKVSVVLPVYNVEPDLARCLDSLIGQTLTDIEIICVNDCSPDNSQEILEKYAAQDTRIRIISHQENRKLAEARNSGLLAAVGEYVAFVDSDDYVAGDFFEKLYTLAKRENADIAKGVHEVIEDGASKGIVSNNVNVRKNKYNFRFTLWTAIFRRSMICGYDIKFVVDTIVFQMKAVYFAKIVATTDDAVYFYVRRDDSNDSPVFSLEKWRNLNIRGAEYVLDFINSVPLEKENYLLLAENLILRLPLHGYERLAKNDISEGTVILSSLLERFRGKIQYMDALKRAFAKVNARMRKYTKLRIPSLAGCLLKPKKISETLQIREIAGRSGRTGKADHFVVAEYPLAVSTNIGDSIQQIAITRALQTLFPDIPVKTVERDAWWQYRSGGLSVMQGWFGYRESFPSGDTGVLWTGTHFTDEMRCFIQHAADANHGLFGHAGFGARDRKTLKFMQSIDSKAYFSRCYALTLPKRAVVLNNGKVFLVNIPRAWEAHIPSGLLHDAVRVGHGVRDVSDAGDRRKYAHGLLRKYANEARLVITCKVHSATPCVAMGIPVVVITESAESEGRMSFLDDLIPINSHEDLKNGRVNWEPVAPDIEDLKEKMLENLRLSVLAAQGEDVDTDTLEHVRRHIAEYSLKKR